jgi:hypothetical protein
MGKQKHLAIGHNVYQMEKSLWHTLVSRYFVEPINHKIYYILFAGYNIQHGAHSHVQLDVS